MAAHGRPLLTAVRKPVTSFQPPSTIQTPVFSGRDDFFLTSFYNFVSYLSFPIHSRLHVTFSLNLSAAIRRVKMIIPRQVPQVAAAVNCIPTIVICALTLILAWIAIVLRIWTKLRLVKSVGPDDWIMLVATVHWTSVECFKLR